MDTPSSFSTDSMGRLKSRLAYFGNDFPSDNLADLFRRLHRWSKDKKFSFLALFIEGSVAVVKEELGKLSQPIPDGLTSIQNIVGLVEAFEPIRTAATGEAIASSLLCILQLGMLIG
jgi:asperthecin polyketide synthase